MHRPGFWTVSALADGDLVRVNVSVSPVRGTPGVHTGSLVMNLHDWEDFRLAMSGWGADIIQERTYWKQPNGNGWVDAWNGIHGTEAEARRNASRGALSLRVLAYGEDIVDETEFERRQNDRNAVSL